MSGGHVLFMQRTTGPGHKNQNIYKSMVRTGICKVSPLQQGFHWGVSSVGSAVISHRHCKSSCT